MNLNDRNYWLVQDPTDASDDEALLGPLTFGQLTDIIRQSGPRSWTKAHTAVYDEQTEAEADLKGRMDRLERTDR
jgi:hypothetical protein